MRKIKILVVGILLLIVPTIFFSLVSADQYTLLCLNKGQKVEFSKCNPSIADRTCLSLVCQYCTSLKDSGVYCPASPNVCNTLGLICSSLGGNSSIDAKPPEITVKSPVQDFIYNSRLVEINVNASELSNMYYYDNVYGRGLWTRLCTKCLSYDGRRNFKDGFNNITIKAGDLFGNEAFASISFYVDSKKPKIRSYEPKRGYANGDFEVMFTEENPKTLVLYYGNNLTGYRNKDLNINDCLLDKGKYHCNTSVDLKDYNGQMIDYRFNITDIAGTSDSKKPVMLKVDTTYPVVTYFNYTILGKYVTFNMSIDELNFDKVKYYDYSSLWPSWKTLCSILKNNACVKKKTFISGIHNLSMQVADEAGNSVEFPVDFEIV